MASTKHDGECVTLASGSNVILLPAQLKATVHMVWLLARPKMAKQDFCELPRWKKRGVCKLDGRFCYSINDIIAGNVTSCLVFWGQLFQGGWPIHEEKSSGEFSVDLLGHEIRFPDGYRNRCFAIKTHVRQCVWTWFQVRMWHLMVMVYDWRSEQQLVR